MPDWLRLVRAHNLSIAAAGALPWYAYLQGHPVRVRYGLPLVAACAETPEPKPEPAPPPP